MKDRILTKYMSFKPVEQKPKTSVWHILNNNSDCLLGIIKWYPQWRQYCCFTNGEAVFNKGCLKTICDFIDELNSTKATASFILEYFEDYSI